MTKKIECQALSSEEAQDIKVKIIKAPLVDSRQLRRIIFSRARALVL
ncbi:MAG: hypothetical protein PHR36_01090 [Patescibacteria group bacterium]|nr:hypothetical protein [Patescibacteria group bacterium]